MGAEGALLSDVLLFVPIDDPVGATGDDVLATGGLLWIDDHDAVGALIDGAVAAGGTGRSFAVHAGDRDVVLLHLGEPAALLADDLEPGLAGHRLGGAVSRVGLSAVLILTHDEAVVAAVALGDVDDHSVSRHVSSLPLCHLDETGVRRHARHVLRHHPAGAEQVDAAAPIGAVGIAGLQRIVT